MQKTCQKSLKKYKNYGAVLLFKKNIEKRCAETKINYHKLLVQLYIHYYFQCNVPIILRLIVQSIKNRLKKTTIVPICECELLSYIERKGMTKSLVPYF